MTSTKNGPLRALVETREARRRYGDLEHALDEALEGLYSAADPGERRELLTRAADAVDGLGACQTAAWGPSEDSTGRPMAEALGISARLLRRLAATEDGGSSSPADAEADTEVDAAGGEVWARLARAADPAERAAYLRDLHTLAAERFGAEAASLLGQVADAEEFRATGQPAADSPADSVRPLPRAVFGVLIVMALVVAFTPALTMAARTGLGMVLIGAALGAEPAYTWYQKRRA